MTSPAVTLRITGESGQLVGEMRVSRAAIAGVATEAKNAGESGSVSLRKITKEAGGIQNAMRSLQRQVLGVAATFASIATVRAFAAMADEINLLDARLNIITKSEERYAIAQRATFQIAQDTRTGLGATVDLYGRLQRATDELGRSQAVALSVTETINQTFKVSGAEAASANAAIIQLSQGLAAGALRGDEFNSVAEQSPRLMEALAASLNVSKGELRELAAEGKLTADVIIDALEDQKEAIEREYKQLPVTISDSFTQLRNVLLLAVGEIDEGGQISARTAEAIGALADEVLRLVNSGALQDLGAGIAEVARHLDVLLVAISTMIGARGIAAMVASLRTALASGGALFAAMGGWVTVAVALGTALYVLATRESEAEKAARLLDDATRTLANSQGEARVAALDAARVARDNTAALLEQAQAALAAAKANATLAASAPRDIGPGERAFQAGQALASLAAISSLQADVDALTGSLARANDQIAESSGFADKARAKFAELTGPLRQVAQSLGLIERPAKATRANLIGIGDSEAALKKAQAAAEALENAHAKLFETVNKARAQVAGPVDQAWAEYAEKIRNMAAAAGEAIAKGDDLVVVQEALREGLDALAEAHGRNLQAIEAENAANERAADISGDLVAALNQEIYLSGLSTQARQVEEILLRAVADAQAEANRQQNQSIALDAAEQASLRAVIAEKLREIDAIDQQREVAERWERTWDEAAGNVATALADVIVDGMDDWDDFGDALVDIAKRTVAQILAEFLKLEVIKPLLDGLLSGVSGNGFNFGSLFGGQGTQSGAGFGALLPVAGAIVGGGYGLTQRGTSTGSVGSLAAGAAYGTAGYIGGTIAYGATLGAAAGAGTAAGVAGGAASGAIGAAGAIPVIGWVIAAIAAIDLITGGKVFGSRYRPESSETSLDIGATGGSASASLTEVRQRALFQGRQWRTRDIAAGAEAEEAAVALFESIGGVMADSARALAVEAPPVIDASIRTIVEYDKKGRETARKILVDVLGRTWEEATAELAATRITAEAIIQTVDSALGGIAEGIENSGAFDDAAAAAGVAGGRFGEEYGNHFHKSVNTAVSEAFTGNSAEAVRGEASAIAERWRDDAEVLLAGAQFLLAAATDIRAGTALLGEGSTLTQITDLTEELAVAGEPLLATYQRLVVSTRLLDDALTLSGVTLDKTREDVVRFAVDIADAAGGLDRAQALWSNYFQIFYSAEERLAVALDRARSTAASQFSDIGLDLSDFSAADGAQAFRTLFEQTLPSLSAEAVVEWLEAADALGIVIDLTGQYAQALGAAANSIEDLMAGVEATIADLEPPEQLGFGDRIAAINAETDKLIARAVELGASEEQLQRIRYAGQLQINQVLEEQDAAVARQAELMAAYRDEVQQIADVIDERTLSEFAIELRDIYRWGDDAAATLNAAAQAAGLEAAAAQDLALVHEEVAYRVAAAIARLRDRGRDLVAQLQGTPLDRIEAQIQQLESAQQGYVNSALGGIEQITHASDNAYLAQRNAQLRIRDFLENLLIGPLGGLRPRDALVEAQSQFDRLLELALGGDVEAQAALPALAQQLLQLGQQVYSSGDPYFALRDAVIEALERVAALPLPAEPGEPGAGPSTGGGGGPVEIGASPELQNLYAERDRLLAEQTAEQQLALAQEVAGIIRDLVLATGDPLLEIAESLGLNLNELVATLGVNLDDLTVTTAIQLADVAQSMGVNLTELATAVGVDLGQLADAQSLLNQALKAEIDSLPEAERDLLRPLLADVEAAARLGDKAGTEAALGTMIEQINNLAPGIRDQLAPFFDGVDPADPVTEIGHLSAIDAAMSLAAAELALQTGLMTDIRDRVAGFVPGDFGFGDPGLPGVGITSGVPSYDVGTGYVPRTGLAMLHQAEMVVPAPVAAFFRREGLPLPSRQLQADVIAEEIRALRAERRQADAEIERRLRALEAATTSGAKEQATAVDKQTEKLLRGAR